MPISYVLYEHVFEPGSGPLPDSDPEACDLCGEPENHWRHAVDQEDFRVSTDA